MAIINGGPGNNMGNMMQMMQMMGGNGNPQNALMQMITKQNPAFAKAIQMLQGKSPQEIQSAVTKLFADQGLDVNQFMGQAQDMAKQFGLK